MHRHILLNFIDHLHAVRQRCNNACLLVYFAIFQKNIAIRFAQNRILCYDCYYLLTMAIPEIFFGGSGHWASTSSQKIFTDPGEVKGERVEGAIPFPADWGFWGASYSTLLQWDLGHTANDFWTFYTHVYAILHVF